MGSIIIKFLSTVQSSVINKSQQYKSADHALLETLVPIRTMKLGLDSTWMVDRLGASGAADKNQSQTPLRECVSQADGWKSSFKAYMLSESLNCVPDSLLVTAAKLY